MATKWKERDKMTDKIHPFECFSTLLDRHDGPAASFSEQEDYIKAMKLTKCSSSKPLDQKIWRKVRQTKASLKSYVRSGVEPQLRREFWLTMLQVKDEDVTMYSKAIGQPDDCHISSPTTPSTHHSSLPSFSHGPSFQSAHERLLQSLSLDNVALLPVLSHLLLHFLEEWEAYASLMKLLQRQCWMDRTAVEEKASILTLSKLLAAHLKGISLSSLQPVGMSEEVFIEQLLSSWYLWPFLNQPFWIAVSSHTAEQAVRVLDMYILEGPKVLYRFALSAIKQFVSSSDSESYKLTDIPLHQYILHYLSTLTFEQCSKWVSDTFSIKLNSWESIFKNWIYNCSVAQKDTMMDPLGVFNHSCSPESGGTFSSSSNISQQIKKKFTLSAYSEILNNELVDQLVVWFPDWALGDTLECLFRASKHGYNLRTLYHKCEDEETLILVIKTLREEVFGAFIVGSLIDRRNNTFFGSGETFLFTLKPHPQCYQWTAESDLILRGNDEEIIIGSGGGNYGIWIDGDLNRGATYTCTSYNNPPLAESNDFHCSAIEVYAITSQQC